MLAFQSVLNFLILAILILLILLLRFYSISSPLGCYSAIGYEPG